MTTQNSPQETSQKLSETTLTHSEDKERNTYELDTEQHQSESQSQSESLVGHICSQSDMRDQDEIKQTSINSLLPIETEKPLLEDQEKLNLLRIKLENV